VYYHFGGSNHILEMVRRKQIINLSAAPLASFGELDPEDRVQWCIAKTT
jgi:hypothetical protein